MNGDGVAVFGLTPLADAENREKQVKTEKNNQENLLNLHNHPLGGLVVKKTTPQAADWMD